jgi:DNA (cytosine-5)-methyltransferase 1|tara:strand:- start:29 stop:1159 length:1131 start_codon:yes stop_codon:yes gene_type:complete
VRKLFIYQLILILKRADLKMGLNAISLFTGAGGLDIGISKAGFNVKVCVENDKHCVSTLKENASHSIIIDKSIKDISSKELLEKAGLKKGEVDLIFGGPPCQSFSSAGKMRSIKDSRGTLIFDFVRLVEEIKPKTFLFENVKQFRYIRADPKKPKPHITKRDSDPNLVINMLRKNFEGLGYTLNWGVLNSADYGAPQKRERTIIIGTLKEGKISFPKKTHSKEGSNIKKWRTLGDAIRNLKQDEEGMEYNEKRKKFLKLIPPGGYWKNLSPDLQKEAMGAKLKLGGGKTGFFRRLSYFQPSPTLCTSPKQPGTDMCHPGKLRPLTVAEYAAIQEFPKSWIFKGNTTQKYKQIGNAVPIRLANAIGKEIKSHIGKSF